MSIDKYNIKDILINNNLHEKKYVLLTIHRHYNTNRDSLLKIFNQLKELNIQIIFPIHPRTKILLIMKILIYL